MPVLREAEQRAAAAAVGVSDVTFLGYPDGQLAATYELRRDIARQIRRVRPQLVLTLPRRCATSSGPRRRRTRTTWRSPRRR